jgi:hypothetical protein
MIYFLLLFLQNIFCKNYSNINDSFLWSNYYVINGMKHPYNVKQESNSYQIIENLNVTHLNIRTDYSGGVSNSNPQPNNSTIVFLIII